MSTAQAEEKRAALTMLRKSREEKVQKGFRGRRPLSWALVEEELDFCRGGRQRHRSPFLKLPGRTVISFLPQNFVCNRRSIRALLSQGPVFCGFAVYSASQGLAHSRCSSGETRFSSLRAQCQGYAVHIPSPNRAQHTVGALCISFRSRIGTSSVLNAHSPLAWLDT